MTSWLGSKIRRRGSLERLKGLYAELLEQVAVSNGNLSQREMEPSSPRANPRRLSFRRNGTAPVEADERDEYLATAFRVLSATRFADKEGDNGGAITLREDESVAAMALAKSMEKSLIEVIREIGEIVINAEHFYTCSTHEFRGDEIFEFFCEKAMLGLLADIVAAKPNCCKGNKDDDNDHCGSFRGVVWSSRVKAQIVHTVSLLVSTVKDASALYFVLSQNSINKLLSGILPLRQWTEQALEVMLPAYVDLLKNLSLQLGSSPHLFPLFLIEEDEKTTFPLFSATLEVLTSKFAQSDSFVHATCLNLIVSILQIDHKPVEEWIYNKAATEQECLANHLCRLLVRRYHRIAHLTTGPVVDSARSNAIAVQMAGLRDQLEALNDMFWCQVPCLSVRLCEAVLRRFIVLVLLHDILPADVLQRPMLDVGVSDIDVIPEQEAFAQTAVFVLSFLFGHVQYDPFIRMLAVAVFHPQTSKLWLSKADLLKADDLEDYAMTQELNSLVKGTAKETTPNLFRGEIIKSLQGVYGDWRVCTASILVDKMIQSKALGLDTLVTLGFIAESSNHDESSTVTVDRSLTDFFKGEHGPKTASLRMALECSTSLAVKIIRLHCLWVAEKKQTVSSGSSSVDCCLRQALESAKEQFFRRVVSFQDVFGVSDIFVGLVEDAAQSCYKHRIENQSGRHVHAFLLNQHDCSTHGACPDVLIRRLRSVEENDVENCRFNARMAIHLRAVCRIVHRLFDNPTIKTSFRADTKLSGTEATSSLANSRFVDEAEDLGRIFSRLQERIQMGEEIDLRGRMVFPFTATIEFSAISPTNNNRADMDSTRIKDGSLSVARELLSSSDGSQLTLVLDPTKMLIAQATGTSVKSSRGSIICCIPLLQVIAAASDGDTLHIAVQCDDIDGLIQNGNLSLHFATTGTSMVVQQYLERTRQVLRSELLEKIKQLFSVEK